MTKDRYGTLSHHDDPASTCPVVVPITRSYLTLIDPLAVPTSYDHLFSYARKTRLIEGYKYKGL
jgi:hypothetical protein